MFSIPCGANQGLVFVHSAAGDDYTATSVIVVFQGADTSQVVMVPILPDDIFEGVEQFTARLSVAIGQSGVMLGANMATVEITDEEDSRPFLRLSHKNILPLYICVSCTPVVVVEFGRSRYTVSESDGFANITVVKQRESAVPISVEFTTADNSAIGIVYTTA